jgi:DNA-damage-inducible protein J
LKKIIDFVNHVHYIEHAKTKEVNMSANSLVQTRIDADVKKRAAEVLEGMGLTVSDAVRILLTRVAHEGGLPAGLTTDPVAHDDWFRAKVKEAFEDLRPPIPHDQVETLFEVRRAKARRKHEEEQE